MEVLTGKPAAALRAGKQFEAAFKILREAANRSRAGLGDRAVSGGLKSHFNDIVNASYSKELGIPYVTAGGKFLKFLGQHGRNAAVEAKHYLELLEKEGTSQ